MSPSPRRAAKTPDRKAPKRCKRLRLGEQIAVKDLRSVLKYVSPTRDDKGPSGEPNWAESEAPAPQRTQRYVRKRVLKT